MFIDFCRFYSIAKNHLIATDFYRLTTPGTQSLKFVLFLKNILKIPQTLLGISSGKVTTSKTFLLCAAIQ